VVEKADYLDIAEGYDLGRLGMPEGVDPAGVEKTFACGRNAQR
jgi:hypothetical protein